MLSIFGVTVVYFIKTQYAYRKGDRCVDTSLKVQHFSLNVLDDSNSRARLDCLLWSFQRSSTVFSEKLVGNKLKFTTLNTYIINGI